MLTRLKSLAITMSVLLILTAILCDVYADSEAVKHGGRLISGTNRFQYYYKGGLLFVDQATMIAGKLSNALFAAFTVMAVTSTSLSWWPTIKREVLKLRWP